MENLRNVLTPLPAPSALVFTQATSFTSVSHHSALRLRLPSLLRSFILPHSGIRTGAVDLGRALVGDSREGSQAWFHLTQSISTDVVRSGDTVMVV